MTFRLAAGHDGSILAQARRALDEAGRSEVRGSVGYRPGPSGSPGSSTTRMTRTRLVATFADCVTPTSTLGACRPDRGASRSSSSGTEYG